jgi:hypothetical protein
MGIIEHMMKAFDRTPGRKEIQALPDKFKLLEERVTSLESALARFPAEGCPFCGARAFRLLHVDMNGQREFWHCDECQQKKQIRHDLDAKNRSVRP